MAGLIFGVSRRSYVELIRDLRNSKGSEELWKTTAWVNQIVIYVVLIQQNIKEFGFIIIVNNIQKEENYSCKFKHIKGDTLLNQLPFIIYHDTVFNDMIAYPYLIKCSECTVIKGRMFYSREKSTFSYSTGWKPRKAGCTRSSITDCICDGYQKADKKALENDCMTKLVLANFWMLYIFRGIFLLAPFSVGNLSYMEPNYSKDRSCSSSLLLVINFFLFQRH